MCHVLSRQRGFNSENEEAQIPTTGVESVRELVLSGTWKVISGREKEDFEARTTLLRAQPSANLSEPWRAGAPSSLGGVVLVEVKSLDLKHGITLSRKVW